MGLEAACVASFDGRTSRGTARLEPDRLTFRGSFHVSAPLAGAQVRTERDRLIIELESGTLTLELGARADTWARAIAHPKSRMEKLGLRPGVAVGIAGPVDTDFASELESSGIKPRRVRAGARNFDVLFLAADDARTLARLARFRSAIRPTGAIWVVRPRGRPEITEAQVMAAGKAAGLVDVKVVRFSETHTAEKFVIPKASRSRPTDAPNR